MSKQYLNGIPYGVSMPYRELTQAEYDTLPDSKNNDGIMYFIKNAGVAGGIKMFALADIYDINEHEIGVWIDGKPLYQKTIDCGYLPNTTEKTVSHSIQNIDKIIKVDSIQIWPNNLYASANYNDASNSNYETMVLVNLTNVRLVTKANSSEKYCYVTVQYTKTTDVPGSGSLTPQGTPTHHYSTDEHVIGTWIDGKPLYEKTFAGSFTNSSSSAQWIVILSPSDVSSLNIDTFVQGFGSFKDTFGDNYPVPNNTGSQLGLGIIDDGLCLRIQDVGNGTVYYRLTIQYTKTTD